MRKIRPLTVLLFVFLFGLFSASHAHAQDLSFLQNKNYKLLTDEKYGDAARNTFDILLPASGTPTALVIYIHGGGFQKGNKSAGFRRKNDIAYFMKNKIAFATINYSYRKPNDSLGVRRSLKDIQHALQYIRFHASKYNIDKSKIACYGNSAGGGASLFLALHDDMAIPNHDGIEGESTKPACVVATATQATYNVFRWAEFIPWMEHVVSFSPKSFYDKMSRFYGYNSYNDFKSIREKTTKELDMLEMADKNDPPVYVMNMQEEYFPWNFNVVSHHTAHVEALTKKLKSTGVEHYAYLHSSETPSAKDVDYDFRTFLVERLK